MKMVSLCAGIGGIDLAAQWAGIETVLFCEIDRYCQSKLTKNYPGVPIINDIRSVNKEWINHYKIGPIGIVAGGIPCQPYSVAGERKGKEDDRYLWPEMFRIVQELRSPWVVVENVAGFIDLALDATMADLESIGYSAGAYCIPACAVGANHERQRVFVVANSSSSGWPEMVLPHYSRERREPPTAWETINAGPLRGACNWQEWETQSGIQLTIDGVPDGMARLKAIGNAVNPYQIYPIFKAIMDIEQGNR